MRFAIRDDDTNYFTTPDTLLHAYSDVWTIVPPSLCVITKVKGNWPKWVDHIYKHKQNTDWEAWEKDNTIYPLHENKELVTFLQKCISENKVDVCFHAKHHRNNDDALPQEVERNYVRCAEYLTNKDYTQDIRNEVAYLSALIEHPVTVFAPPQDLLSMKGYLSVLEAGLSVCGGGISFLKKQKHAKGVLNLLKQFSFKTIFPNDPYPYVLDFKTHREIPNYHPLLPQTTYEELVERFETVRKHDGDFVLSTHHAEFYYKTEYDNTITMKDVLLRFLNYISKYKVAYVTLSKMLDSNQTGQSFKSIYHLKKH